MKPSLYLISLKLGKTCWGFDEPAKWLQKKASTMPLSIATVASIAKRQPNYWRDLFYFLGVHVSIFNFYKKVIENPNTVRVKCPIRLTD